MLALEFLDTRLTKSRAKANELDPPPGPQLAGFGAEGHLLVGVVVADGLFVEAGERHVVQRRSGLHGHQRALEGGRPLDGVIDDSRAEVQLGAHVRRLFNEKILVGPPSHHLDMLRRIYNFD